MSAKLNIHVVDMEAHVLELAKQVSLHFLTFKDHYCRLRRPEGGKSDCERHQGQVRQGVG